jgi:hypothetical protein
VRELRFSEIKLEDNVGLLVALQPVQLAAGASTGALTATTSTGSTTYTASTSTDTAAAAPADRPTIVVANTHIMFDPRRGECKLGQIRTLFEAAHEWGEWVTSHSAIDCRPLATQLFKLTH